MIDQNRLVRMVQLSRIESEDKNGDVITGRYRKSDFMTLQMILAVASGTFCYMALVLFWLGLRWDSLNEILMQSGYRGIATRGAGGYIAFLAAYLLLSVLVGRCRYREANEKREACLEAVRKLEAAYDTSPEEADGAGEAAALAETSVSEMAQQTQAGSERI